MKKILFLLLISFFSFQLFTSESIIKLRSSLQEAKGLGKAKILYILSSLSDSLEVYERIEFCLQAEEIALDIGDNELLLDILSLESNLYRETSDLEKYSSSIEKYFILFKEMTDLKIESNTKQVCKQIIIRNIFMIGFITFLNITIVIIIRYHRKTTDHIKLEKANNQLEELSRKDPLTSISNRRDILEKILYETTRVKRNQKIFSLIMCDIDHFKSVNDKYGHECGDYILKKNC